MIARIALGAIAFVALAAAFFAAIPVLIKPAMRLVFGFHYRVRVVGTENIPRHGPMVLTCNHITWIDAFLLASIAPRPFWYLTNASFIAAPFIRMLAERSRMIPVPASGPRAQRRAIESARRALDQGKAVAIFPEAQMTRNGRLGTFLRGLELILKDRPHVTVIPVYFDNLWGSVFSYSAGRFFGRFSEVKRRRVTIVFGKPVDPPITAFSVRQAVIAASFPALALRDGTEKPLEAYDRSLPHWEHPELGLLAASSPNFDKDGIKQTGMKPGSVGQAVEGVLIEAIDEAGGALDADETGRLVVSRLGRDVRAETGARGFLDKEGFVHITTNSENQVHSF